MPVGRRKAASSVSDGRWMSGRLKRRENFCCYFHCYCALLTGTSRSCSGFCNRCLLPVSPGRHNSSGSDRSERPLSTDESRGLRSDARLGLIYLFLFNSVSILLMFFSTLSLLSLSLSQHILLFSGVYFGRSPGTLLNSAMH